MFNKIYICLDWYNLDEVQEIKNYSFLSHSNFQEIFRCFYSKSNTYEENQIIMQYTTSLEYFLFYTYLLKIWYDTKNIETLINPSLFIYNDTLFIIDNWEIKQLFIEQVGFFSIRWINWQHPFFFILKTLLSSKWWKALRNNDYSYMNTRWKFFALNSLYKKRSELLWDIIIPFNIKKSDYQVFANFLKNNLGDSILIKKDFYSCWMWNFPINLSNFDSFQENKFINAIKNNSDKIDAIYIVPIEKFIEEYRIYFVKFEEKINIYSVKTKRVNITKDEIHKMEVFKYGGYYDWEYIELEKFYLEYNYVYEVVLKYLETLDYNFWNIEIWKKENWEFSFFEVNTMWSALPYKGNDTNSLINYYENIFKHFIN